MEVNPKGSEVRTYLAAHPDAKAAEVAAKFGVTTSYVYGVRSHMNKVAKDKKAKAKPRSVLPPELARPTTIVSAPPQTIERRIPVILMSASDLGILFNGGALQ